MAPTVAADAAAAELRARAPPQPDGAAAPTRAPAAPARQPRPPPPGGAGGGALSGQARLRIGPPAAFWALAAAPVALWFACVLAGVYLHEGLPEGQRRVNHLMIWFDDLVVRPWGPLLPFAVLALRLAANAAGEWLPGGADGGGARGAARRALRASTLAGSCLLMYAAVAAARGALYMVHYRALRSKLLTFHLVSDHLFLGAAILACLHAEALCLLSDASRSTSRSSAHAGGAGGGPGGGGGRGSALREAGLAAAFAAAVFLAFFTAADMYFTAKHFHHPLESAATAVLAFLIFQAPVLLWLSRSRGRAAAAPGAGAAAAAGRARAAAYA